jgi:hypothetical protein
LDLKDEAIGEWRKLHNEELNDMYSSQNIIRAIKSRRMRWAGHVAHMWGGGGEGAIGLGRGNLRERDHLEDRCRWEVNIKLDPQEMECRGMDWIELA